MGCLEDDTIVAYVERRLPAADRARVMDHLETCSDCLTITNEVMGSGEHNPEPVIADADTIHAGPPSNMMMARPPAPPERGLVVGRYTVLELIGQGGMGSVYAAHDPQLDRKVAIKLVRSDRLAEAADRARLSREARAMAKLSHPNVVTVHDAGQVEQGVFIAMEFVEGTTLARWLHEAPRSWEEVRDVFLLAGKGLAAAHAAGMVHRDFKPENVLIDPTGRVAVTDFGLAVVTGGGPPSSVPLAPSSAPGITQTGALVGTPSYMSPEQYNGGTVDARSDQFSFAVAFYEGLYRDRPFQGASIAQLREAVTRGVIPNPSTEARANVPEHLWRLVTRALSTEPEERFPTMDALLAQMVATPSTVPDAPPLPPPPSRGRTRSNLALALAGLAAALAAILLMRARSPVATLPVHVTPAGTGATPTAGTAPRAAVLIEALDNRTGDALLDGTLGAVLSTALYPSTALDPYEGPMLRTLTSELAEQGAPGDAGPERALVASGRRTVVVRGAATAEGGGFALKLTARDAATDAVVLEQAASGPTPAALLPHALRFAGGLRAALGEPGARDRAARPLSQSLEALHAWVAGKALNRSGDYFGAIEQLKRAAVTDPELIDAHWSLGLAFCNVTSNQEGARELEIALAHSDQLEERERLMLLGDYYGAVGRYPESVAAYEQLLSKWPGDPNAEMRVVGTALDAGEWRLATELGRRAVAHHPTMVVPRSNLVLALVAGGAFDDALREGEATLAQFTQTPRYTSVFVGITQALLGHTDKARDVYAQSAAADAEFADEASADLALYEGRLDDAQALLQRQIDLALARHAAPDARTEYMVLAELLLRRGDAKGATAAGKAAMGGGSVRNVYLGARVLCEAGHAAEALAATRSWADDPNVDYRMHAKLVEADAAAAHQRWKEAVSSYKDAVRMENTWMGHARLGEAYARQGAWADAQRELELCVARRGEAAIYATPSLHQLSPVYFWLARAKDGAHDADAADAYADFLAREPAPQHDPLADDARRRLAVLRGAKTP
jgi:tetratricopeptide (TPR) repeat protein/tRNA A-37 threonylcarbamoyl transferase component Bud32